MAARTPKSPAKKTPSKPAKSRPSTKADERPRSKKDGATAVVTRPARKSARPTETPERPLFLPRAMASVDDDVLMASGGGGGGYGRCGGRALSNRLEQQFCQRLGIAGVVHSHSPRHYEIRFEDSKVAAYAPMIVLRGRGREGKGVVIEAVEDPKSPILRKIIAFRAQYGQEFYVIMVASDDVLDQVPLAAYDESCSSTNVNTLIARLAE